MALGLLLVFVSVSSSVPAAFAADRANGGASGRDFPPLEDPNAPSPAPTPAPPAGAPPLPGTSGGTTAPTGSGGAPADSEPYRLGVGDELQVAVLAQPTLSGLTRVRPDGLISTPGAGEVFALGRTPSEVNLEITERLRKLLRHPYVDLMVTEYGDQVVFVMGEVEVPGEKPFYKGMSTIQAIAQAGGISRTGKAGSVLVLRRLGPDQAEVHHLDVGAAFDEKEGQVQDLGLQAYDIVYVPRTFIANVNVFVDQYMRQMIAPFSLYLEGWKAFHLKEENIRIYP